MTGKKESKDLTTKLDLGNNVKVEIIKFDGSNQKCVEFLTNFRSYAKAANWDDLTMARKLLWCLAGPALQSTPAENITL